MPSDVLRQYQSITEESGLLDLSARGKLKATGADHVGFLQAMITNDVQNLPEWRGRRGCLLTATGKIVADFFYYRFADWVLLDLPPGLVPSTRSNLERYIVMDEVDLHDISADLAHLLLLGPSSAEVLREGLQLPLPLESMEVKEVKRQGESIWIVNKPRLGLPGYELILPQLQLSHFRDALIGEQETTVAGFEALDLLRLEKGVPEFGIDYNHHNNPLEAGLTEAISYGKGCYIGQEVISKATYVGGVSRSLVPLRIEGDRAPEKGAEVVDAEGRRIGQVTSAVFSPAMGQVMALAFIRKKALAGKRTCGIRVREGVLEATLEIQVAGRGEL
jgi:folate-binding protein YgfZ